MPVFVAWLRFFTVIILIILFNIVVTLFSNISDIKKPENWPKYRCNPMYMYLADNIEDNFIYCIQNMQSSFLGFQLQPLTSITSSITDSLGNFMTEINSIRAMINKIRTFFSSITSDIFTVFINLVIEFKKITIGIQDLIGKNVGIVMSMLYIMDGGIKTGGSAWNGPPGQIVRSLGKCFDPYANIQLKDGTIKCMKDINLGDILEDGSVVEIIMKIDNKIEPVPFYKIPNGGVNGQDIYVTGSHLIYDKLSDKFIKVENYKKSILSDKKTEWFSCLITDTHKIKIGDEIFWDWEDHFVKINMLV